MAHRILHFLFPQFRRVELQLIAARQSHSETCATLTEAQRHCAVLEQQVSAIRLELLKASGQSEYWKAKHEAATDSATVWRERCERAESRADSTFHEMTEKLSNAGDSLSMRFMARRLFSKAPVEAPPAIAQNPINVSRGASKMFASDLARQQDSRFFEKLAKERGVMPAAPESDQKPN